MTFTAIVYKPNSLQILYQNVEDLERDIAPEDLAKARSVECYFNSRPKQKSSRTTTGFTKLVKRPSRSTTLATFGAMQKEPSIVSMVLERPWLLGAVLGVATFLLQVLA